MSMGECLVTMPGKRLAAIGFLSEDGQASYRKLSGLGWSFLKTERTRVLLTKKNITVADRECLRVALQADISDLRCQLPWVNCVAIATPGLGTLAENDAELKGMEIVGQADVLVQYCIEHGYGYIGLLGTEWDVNADSPLVQTLERNQIQIFAPSPDHRALLSACATGALRGWIQYQGRVLDGYDFCAEAVGHMIHEACGLMQALVICNPELRPLAPRLKAKRRQFFATTPIVDLTGLYWDALQQKISQSRAKTSG